MAKNIIKLDTPTLRNLGFKATCKGEIFEGNGITLLLSGDRKSYYVNDPDGSPLRFVKTAAELVALVADVNRLQGRNDKTSEINRCLQHEYLGG